MFVFGTGVSAHLSEQEAAGLTVTREARAQLFPVCGCNTRVHAVLNSFPPSSSLLFPLSTLPPSLPLSPRKVFLSKCHITQFLHPPPASSHSPPIRTPLFLCSRATLCCLFGNHWRRRALPLAAVTVGRQRTGRAVFHTAAQEVFGRTPEFIPALHSSAAQYGVSAGTKSREASAAFHLNKVS